MKLDKFLKLYKPTEYNFELENVRESDLATYSKLATYSRYFTYKASQNKPIKYINGRKFVKDTVEKYGCIADPDGTLGTNESYTCMLSRELYRKLWGWENFPKGKLEQYGDVSVVEFGALGPDTMNSAQTTLNHVIKDAFENCKDDKIKKLKNGNISINFMLELYSNECSKEALISWLDDVKELQEFLDLYHTLGNFVLVPAYFNPYRASQVNDYWDKSLELLKSKNKVWTYKKQKILWDKKLYIRYVNYFFLWDYTEGYNPRIVSDIRNMEDMEEFLKTTCGNIRRRGDFMVAMLKIQEINPEYYSQLIENIFNTENLYRSYEDIVEAIKNESCYLDKKVKQIIEWLVERL